MRYKKRMTAIAAVAAVAAGGTGTALATASDDDANNDTRIERAIKDGKLTQQRADQIKKAFARHADRKPGHGERRDGSRPKDGDRKPGHGKRGDGFGPKHADRGPGLGELG